MTQEFDFDKAVEALQSGQALTGKDGVLTPLIKQLTEAVLDAELQVLLAGKTVSDRKNGKSRKTLMTTSGSVSNRYSM